MAAASATERIARQEQRSDDIDRRLTGLEEGQREIVKLLADVKEHLHRSNGRAAAIGWIADGLKMAIGAAAGGIAGAVAAAWRGHVF